MKIITIATTNLTFILIQQKSINKFIKSKQPVEFIVFNDAKDWPDITNFNDVTIKQKIKEMCNSLNIKCIDIPNQHHRKEFNASNRHADSMNYITKYMIDDRDKYFIIDSDMFFVTDYDLDILENYYLGYVEQQRVIDNKLYKYPWPNLVYINTFLAPNLELLNWDSMKGLDAGGKAGFWLLTLNKLKVKEFGGLKSEMWDKNSFPIGVNKKVFDFLNKDPRNKNGRYFAELFESKIFHYRGGSNWMLNSRKIHDTLTKLLDILIEEL